MSSVFEDLKSIALRHNKIANLQIKDETKIATDLGMDSIQLITFIVEIEQFFDIEIDSEILDKMNKLLFKELVEYISNEKSHK